MNILRFFIFIFLIFSSGDYRSLPDIPIVEETKVAEYRAIKGALLSTRFKSFEELKKVIHIEYFYPESKSGKKPLVRISHRSGNRQVCSIIYSDVDENDIKAAKAGSLFKKIGLGLQAPYIVFNKDDMMRVFLLGRRIGKKFGEGDVAFYDFAETMMLHIDEKRAMNFHDKDFSEKGFINTFNHINAQAFMTSIFSETLADFIADAHERGHMPELITGAFSKEQIEDLHKGPLDNYVDVVNNEWGQELGKSLKKKYNISRATYWTPELLTNYLNDIQIYYGWAFQISFEPFKSSDEKVIRYATKINRVLNDPVLLKY